MQTRNVVVTQEFFDDQTIAYLEANGCTVTVTAPPSGPADRDLCHDDLIGLLTNASAWIVGHANVTRVLLKALPRLQIVARRGVGYDRVDVQAARDLGRVVTIAAGGNDGSVADHAIGLMIGVARRFRESHSRMAGGDWSILQGSDLSGKTVGIVGFGRIGRSLAKRLIGFEPRLLVHTLRHGGMDGAALGVTFCSLPELLERSDFVSLHLPLTPATRLLIDADALSRMKCGAVLINTARGGLVDDAALLAALIDGKLAGAGLDVFASESDRAFGHVTDALLKLPNVMATPHSGASSREGLARTNGVAARCVIAVLNGAQPAPECVVADGRVVSCVDPRSC